MRFKILILISLLSLLLPVFGNMYTTQQDELVAISADQKESLERLKNDVAINLPQDYMKEDIYLFRFLKHCHWKFDRATTKINEMARWRGDNKMDTIAKEKMDDMAKEFPITNIAVDKDGRPVLEIPNLGSWQIANAVTMNNMDKLKRYFIQQLEIVQTRLRELSGKDASSPTQFVILANLQGLNEKDNACPACLSFYSYFAEMHEKYYPLSAGLIVFVNTPRAYDLVAKTIYPIFNKETNEAIKVFDSDPKVWKPFVLEHFEEEHINPIFGGKKVLGGGPKKPAANPKGQPPQAAQPSAKPATAPSTAAPAKKG